MDLDTLGLCLRKTEYIARTELADTVTDWLDDHVDPETGYVIDNSLTIEGAAADAKATGDEISNLNDTLSNTPMMTNRVLTQSSEIEKSALAALDTGCYIIQCESKPSDFKPASAYGVLFNFGDSTSYHHIIYSGDGELWKLTCDGTTASNWQSLVPTYMDVNLTVGTAGTPIQIDTNSGGKVNAGNFINAYVVDTNHIVVQINTYRNYLYAKFYKNTGEDAPAATYKLRCWYYPS